MVVVLALLRRWRRRDHRLPLSAPATAGRRERPHEVDRLLPSAARRRVDGPGDAIRPPRRRRGAGRRPERRAGRARRHHRQRRRLRAPSRPAARSADATPASGCARGASCSTTSTAASRRASASETSIGRCWRTGTRSSSGRTGSASRRTNVSALTVSWLPIGR